MTESSNEQWTPCRPGEVSAMVDRLQRSRRKEAMQKVATAAVCLLAAISAGTVYWQQQDIPAQMPRLSHQQALEWLSDYRAGTLDDDQTAQMEAHLAHCEACRKKLESMKPDDARIIPGLPDKQLAFAFPAEQNLPEWITFAW